MTNEPITKDVEIKKRGLNGNPRIFIPNESLVESLHELGRLPIAQKEYSVHKMKMDDALYDAQSFLSYYYDLRKVPYLHMTKILGFSTNMIRDINPLKLPIRLIDTGDIFSGAVVEVLTKESSRKPHILFREINLSLSVTEQTSASYIHEVTHTQLDRLRGSLKEYYNLEVLSVFNELFHASLLKNGERILRLNDSRRIHEMSVTAQELLDYSKDKTTMDREELLDCCKYLISDLKAYQLFVIFYNATTTVQNEILDDIQRVFDGCLTVEEVLYKYGVTLQSCQDVKKLTKYFNR